MQSLTAHPPNQQKHTQARQRAVRGIQEELPSRRTRHKHGHPYSSNDSRINNIINDRHHGLPPGSEVRRIISSIFLAFTYYSLSFAIVSALCSSCPPLCFSGVQIIRSMDYPTNLHGYCSKPYGEHDDQQDQEGALGDWDHSRFTPSMLDTNSFAFSNFVNQHSGEFTTPTPGGSNNFFHNPAGDLHIPGMAFQLGTPLSSDDSHPVSAVDMQAFHQHLLQNQPFPDHRNYQPQQSFAPSSFIHRDSGYDTTEASNVDAIPQKPDEHHQSEPGDYSTRPCGEALKSSMPSLEK